MECRRSGSGFLGRGEFMKTRHRHRVGSQLFPYFPVTAFRRVTPWFMYMWDCHCDICKHSRANVLDRRESKQLTKIGKRTCPEMVHGCAYVKAMGGHGGSPEELSLADFASHGPSDKAVSWEPGGAQGTRTQGCANTLFTMNTTSSVSKHYFRAYKNMLLFPSLVSLPHIKNK